MPHFPGPTGTRFDGSAEFPHISCMLKQSLITIDPARRSGKPCVRDTRIAVHNVLEYLASRMTETELIAEFPELAQVDIRACLVFAADRERRLVGVT
jgi:uncharacterized protein (DUF433 family)